MLLLNMVIMVGALANIAVTAPQYLIAAFNPVTLNLLMIALSLIGFIAGRDVSSAERRRNGLEYGKRRNKPFPWIW